MTEEPTQPEPYPGSFMPMRHPRGHPDKWVHAEVGSKEYDRAVAELRAAHNQPPSPQAGA